MAQDILQKAKECFKEDQEAFRENRERMLEDLRFSNPACPEQWDDAVRRSREQSEGGARPCLTFDQTNQYIAQVVNDSRQNKPGIKVIPVDSGADIEVAEKLEGMIRHIEYSSRAGIAYDTAQEYAARIGIGWLRVVPEIVEAERNEQEVRIKRVHDPLSVILDANSQEPDGSDSSRGFVETVLTKRSFKGLYPKAAAISWDPSDRIDGWLAEDSVRVCEYFYKVETKVNNLVITGPEDERITVTEDEYWRLAEQTGFRPQVVATYESTQTEVKWVKMTGMEILEETDFPSRFIPLVPVLGYELYVEGKRYLCGMTRRMMDSQRAYNYERTSYIEQVALQPKAPFAIPWESVENFQDEWATANTSNRAYLPYNALDGEGRPLPPPQRQGPPPVAAAFVQGGALALSDIQASIGMYRANLGAPSNETSGRAINARQREGDTANYHYIDNLSRSIEQLGRIVVDMIPRIYDTQRVARITGDDGSIDAVTINPEMGQAKQRTADALVINPGVGEYDVRVKAGPSYTTLRQESAEAIGQILQGNPQAFAVLGPEWARMQDWPNSEKVSQMLLAMAPPQVQALAQGDKEIPAPIQAQMQGMQQQVQQLQQALMEARQKLDTNAVEAMQKMAEADKDRAIDAYKAETERLKIMSPAMGPQEIRALVLQTLQQLLTSQPIPPESPGGVQAPNQPPQGGFFTP
ncbi:portal protein [Achromobacter anxifer]|uniref:portal protein n=1 Tax=Achromobacter anxifer TaxID=1287737 RepID=UPI0023F9B24D|nr:portal protein [Achromobacter anxifer]MDF8361929.1 portal protein [Achromobacter anxifer]